MSYGYSLAIIAAALWGLNYSLDQRVLAEISVVKLYFLQCLLGTIITLAIWLGSGRSFASLASIDQTKLGLRVIGITLVVGVIASMVIFASIRALGATRASVIEISYPLFVAVFSYFIFGESLSWAVLGGGLLIFSGVSLIVLYS